MQRWRRLLLLLQFPHLGVEASGLQQLKVRAALDDAPGVHDQDLVRIHDRR
jgi:hypothetical protein